MVFLSEHGTRFARRRYTCIDRVQPIGESRMTAWDAARNDALRGVSAGCRTDHITVWSYRPRRVQMHCVKSNQARFGDAPTNRTARFLVSKPIRIKYQRGNGGLNLRLPYRMTRAIAHPTRSVGITLIRKAYFIARMQITKTSQQYLPMSPIISHRRG